MRPPSHTFALLLLHWHTGLVLPYPQSNFNMEFSFAWLYILLEIPRLYLRESQLLLLLLDLLHNCCAQTHDTKYPQTGVILVTH